MKLNKFAYLCSKPLGNRTLKIIKKYLEIYWKTWKNHGNIMEFCQSEKVGTLNRFLAQIQYRGQRPLAPRLTNPGSASANNGQIRREQECIPVGCVPPARYHTGGLPDRDTPGAETSPPDREPPGQRHPLWTESQAGVKTLPFTQLRCWR